MNKASVIGLCSSEAYSPDGYITCRKHKYLNHGLNATCEIHYVKIAPENGETVGFSLEDFIEAINELADDFEIVKKEKPNDA